MTRLVDISKCDVIYLSYDEPNADENYKNLISYIPYAKRIHGVKGSDSAHKACAKLASTERFVVIDGDNYLIKSGFEKQIVAIDNDNIDINKSVLSWPSYNIINGLIYGNGGIKCWPTEIALSMKTHENAPKHNKKSSIDFCWEINYVPLDTVFSEIRNNSSPLHAWRAGFREGVKMSLDQGNKVSSVDTLWSGNVDVLLIWMTVGSDVNYGIWAMLGARMGCYLTLCTDWDFIQVRDFDSLNLLWKQEVESLSAPQVKNKIKSYDSLISNMLVIPEMMSIKQSKFFKRFNVNRPRQSEYVKIINPQ